MDVICIYKPSVIYLTGDKEREAFANYMWNRHKVRVNYSSDFYALDNFCTNFFKKYNAEAVLCKRGNKLFYYPKFK